MPIVLPPLPWEKDALQPHMSKETIEYHYGKHHAGYVTKLNGMVPGTEWEGKELDDIMLKAPAGGLFNNAAQIWNHSFFWNSLAPNAGGAPTGPIADAINDSFGSFDAFKTKFSEAAVGHFGSGWAWLVKKDGKLAVVGSHDAGNPLRDGSGFPILNCDVWEHAYYVDYRNNRGAYVEAYWNLVNWKFANEQLAKAP